MHTSEGYTVLEHTNKRFKQDIVARLLTPIAHLVALYSIFLEPQNNYWKYAATALILLSTGVAIHTASHAKNSQRSQKIQGILTVIANTLFFISVWRLLF